MKYVHNSGDKGMEMLMFWKRAKKKKVNTDKTAGFSVAELAIAIMVSGILVVPIYKTVFIATKLGPTENRMELIRSGLAEHLRVFGYLPCPGSLTAAPGAANYLEDPADPACAAGTTVASPVPLNTHDVYIGSVPIARLRLAMDCLSENDTDVTDLPANIQAVLRRNMTRIKDKIAWLNTDADTRPLQAQANYATDITKCPTDEHLIDANGNKFLYAVSERATQVYDATTAVTKANTFDPNDPTVGGIAVVDQDGDPATLNGQVFILISHGENQRGSFSKTGDAVFPACGTGGNTLDSENCDGDGTFRNMMNRFTEDANHFDDEVDFSLAGVIREIGPWNRTTNDDIIFTSNSRMIVDPVIPAAPAPDDRLVVNNGPLGAYDDGGTGGNIRASSGGTFGQGIISAGNDIVAEQEVESRTIMSGDRFCYLDTSVAPPVPLPPC